MTVDTVRPGTPEERAFLDLPERLHAGNRCYVPWFHSQIRGLIARRNPWFEHSDAGFFVARNGSQTLGRIALLEPTRYNEHHQAREARFAFFECVDDPDAARALFARGAEWAAGRGLDALAGPYAFSSFGGAGLLIHGYDRPASMTMVAWHPPYYRRLVEDAGFRKQQDFHCPYLFAGRHDLSPEYTRMADIAAKRGRFSIQELRTKAELRAVAHEFRDTYNDAWSEREVFIPLDEGEIDRIVDDLLLVSDPSLIRILRAGDEMAGFVLAFPDLTNVMIRARGRLHPLTILRLMRAKRTTRRYLINGFGLRPRYRKTGGTALLFADITAVLKSRGAQGAEMTQVAADNDLMMANVTRLGADIVKTHRVYRIVV